MGEHAAAIAQLQEDMHGVKADVREIRDFVISVKAKWAVVVSLSLGFGAFAGAVVAFVADIAKTVIEKRALP